MKKIITYRCCIRVFLFLSLAIPQFVRSQITITASADTVAMDGIVEVTLTGTIPDYIQDAELPYSDGYIVVGNRSNYSFTSAGNKVHYDQTFTLQPMRTGTFSIGPASMQVGNKKIFSNKLSIVISSSGSTASSGSGGAFMTCEPSNSKPYLGEPVTLTIRVYQRSDAYPDGVSQPISSAFNGFYHVSGSYPMDRSYPDTVVTIHGNRWIGKAVYREFVFPNKLGKVDLPVYTYTCDVAQGSGGGSYYSSYTQSVDLQSKPATIEVLPPPDKNKPAIFAGDVGSFSMISSLENATAHANDPMTLKITVTGSGNFSLLQWPALKLPDGFNAYDANTEFTTDVSSERPTGNKKFTFTFVPTKEGDYVIPAQQFAFYDYRRKEYRTLSTDSFPVHILPALPDTATVQNNLPQTFLTEDHSSPLWLKIMLITLPLMIGGVIYLVYRSSKKKKQRALEEAQKKEEQIAENIPTGPTPWDNFRKAEEFFRYGNSGRCMAELYGCIRFACCLKGELGDDEASPGNIRYRLGTKKLSADVIDDIMRLLDELSALRYNRSALTPAVIGKYMTETHKILTKLGF